MNFKITHAISGIFSIIMLCSISAAKIETITENKLAEIQRKIEWLKSSHAYGSACVRIAHDKIIYIDPSGLSSEQTRIKADLILVTHSHDDHFSTTTIQDLSKESTTIIAPKDCHDELIKTSSGFKLKTSFPGLEIKALSPGENASVEDMSIETVPAYNLESSAHPRVKGWLGYIVTIGGVRIYHSGDTSFIPEMKELNDIDIAILTVRDHYMMNGKQVVDAIASFRPKVVIPVHWLQPEEPDIQYIQEHAPSGIEVLILEPLH
ncbi:MAG: MBL fold metallo-hydrolase [Candidatus Aminicenantes bacterium]|jgi:L-ascorbate metabolism protein UlaG (beta-lactamase superfamily)